MEEVKYLDTVEPAGVIATTGTFSNPSLNIVPQDDTASGRTGRKITIVKLFMRGEVILPATTVAADASDKVRILLVQDKQANGANPTAATLLETADINAFMNMFNVSRFTVLHDEIVAVNASAAGAPTGTPAFGRQIVPFKIAKTGLNIPIEYDASASSGALTTIRSNNIFLFCISLSAKATVSHTCRIRYLDN